MSASVAHEETAIPVRWRAATRSHVGLIRQINEDRLFDGGDRGVWAVVDGMGGHSGGDLAAQQVVDTLRRADGAMTADGLEAALQDANAAIHARNRRLGSEAGATAVAAVTRDGALTVVWAGDSRAYLIDGGVVTQLTRDHSLVQELVDAGAIDARTAAGHPQANIVTRALGIFPAVTLDRVTVRPGLARLLLCSDGLSRTLSDADLLGSETVDALADRLLANALARDGSDNVSLVLVEIDQPS